MSDSGDSGVDSGDSGVDSGELVVVARFESVGAAQAARSRLEADGIRSIVAEQDFLRLDPLRRETRSPIRLLVLDRDAADARSSLEATWEGDDLGDPDEGAE